MTALLTATEFRRELERRDVSHELRIVRDEALMISVAVPGERWEIEFFDDGRIELERFVSQGVVVSIQGAPVSIGFGLGFSGRIPGARGCR